MKHPHALYDDIGTGYNLTRRPDPFITEKLFHLLSPQKTKFYLDIGCGTGNYTVSLIERGYHFCGVDPSEQMLQEARARSGKACWSVGSSEKIFSDDKTFDGAIATLTIHHWNDLEKSFNELFRVLKEGSKFILFTSTPEQMKSYWL